MQPKEDLKKIIPSSLGEGNDSSLHRVCRAVWIGMQWEKWSHVQPPKYDCRNCADCTTTTFGFVLGDGSGASLVHLLV